MNREDYYKYIEENDFYPEHSHKWIVRTYTGDNLKVSLGNETPAPDKLGYLEQRNNRHIEIKKQFDAWFGEMEGYSFRHERFWDDFDCAKDKKDYHTMKIMVKWLRSAFQVGYERGYQQSNHNNEDT
tara:strand:- start:664 stop:1044 length:381 start_codon:yes stop_codon:yes gene_type:complete